MVKRLHPIAVPCLLATVLTVLATVPAGAAGPSLTASRTTGLDPAGETIAVRGSGFTPGITLYVALCVPGASGSVPGAGDHPLCSTSDHFTTVDTDGHGAFRTTLTVGARFTSGAEAVDCTVRRCALQTSRVGMGSDRSQEAAPLPLSFATAAPTSTTAPPTASPTTVPPTTVPPAAPPTTAPLPTAPAAGTGSAGGSATTSTAPSATATESGADATSGERDRAVGEQAGVSAAAATRSAEGGGRGDTPVLAIAGAVLVAAAGVVAALVVRRRRA